LPNILNDIKNFAVYYGYDNEQALMDYDLLILEPKAHSQSGLNKLKDAGKLVIAYVSIIEISKDDESFSLLSESDLLRHNGDLVINQEYQTYYLDITKENVRSIIVQKAISHLKSGYDGIFLDTIGNIEYLDLNNQELYESAAIILNEVKLAFPSCIIIQNNGFLELYDYTAKYLNAICFENPPISTIGSLIWTYSAIIRLNAIAKEYNVKVLLLEEDIYNKSSIKTFFMRKIARKNGWLYYKSAKYYNHI